MGCGFASRCGQMEECPLPLSLEALARGPVRRDGGGGEFLILMRVCAWDESGLGVGMGDGRLTRVDRGHPIR